MQRRSEAKERFWRKMIGGLEATGGSVRRWCESHGVSEGSFYACRRELARGDRAVAGVGYGRQCGIFFAKRAG